MCLLIGIKAGVEKSTDFLFEAIRKASITNKDGMGFAYKKANQNKVWIQKGFHDVDKFIETLQKKNLKLNDELIVHLRIGNKGAKTDEMNHPFVISDEEQTILKSSKYVDLPVVAHNGTFYDFSLTSSKFSDTYFFIQDFLAVPEILDLLKRDKVAFIKAFSSILRTNKLAFIFPDKTPLITLGSFMEDQGYLFSNESYRLKIYNVGGNESYYPLNKNYSTRSGYEEDDDDEVITNSYVGKQTALPIPGASFGSPSHKDILAYTVEQNQKLVSTGEKRTRDKDGLLQANSKLEIIPPRDLVNLPPVTNNLYKGMLFPTKGKILYTPLRFISNQLYESIFTPTIFNYTHFRFRNPLGNLAMEINPRLTYKIDAFEDKDPNDRDLYHWLVADEYDPSKGSTKHITDSMWMNTTSIIRNFKSDIRIDIRSGYITVYNLAKRFDNPSKNLIAKLYDGIEAAVNKDKSLNINYRNVEHCTLLGLKLFYNYNVLAIYDYDVAKNMFYEVQEAPKTIDIFTAINAINNIKN